MWKWSYSDGERAGVVQKFSRSGWLCKTWEGELNMVVLPALYWLWGPREAVVPEGPDLEGIRP